MGMSIDIDVVDIARLKEQFSKKVEVSEGQIPTDELIDKVLPEFGIVIDNLFIAQTADYWDDYCPWYQIMEFFERYYDASVYDLFSESRVAWRYKGANADDVASGLNIELPRRDDE